MCYYIIKFVVVRCIDPVWSILSSARGRPTAVRMAVG